MTLICKITVWKFLFILFIRKQKLRLWLSCFIITRVEWDKIIYKINCEENNIFDISHTIIWKNNPQTVIQFVIIVMICQFRKEKGLYFQWLWYSWQLWYMQSCYFIINYIHLIHHLWVLNSNCIYNIVKCMFLILHRISNGEILQIYFKCQSWCPPTGPRGK